MEKYFSVCECMCTREGLCCTSSDLSLLFIYFFYLKTKYLQIVLPVSEMYLMPKTWVFVVWFFFTLIVHLTDMVGKIGKPRYPQRMFLLLSVLGRAGKAFLTAALPSAHPKKGADLDPHCTELEGALAIPSISSRVNPEALRILFSKQ